MAVRPPFLLKCYLGYGHVCTILNCLDINCIGWIQTPFLLCNFCRSNVSRNAPIGFCVMGQFLPNGRVHQSVCVRRNLFVIGSYFILLGSLLYIIFHVLPRHERNFNGLVLGRKCDVDELWELWLTWTVPCLFWGCRETIFSSERVIPSTGCTKCCSIVWNQVCGWKV